jgi:alkylation response protein AidB-like acyl-CoA dehydrogenase
MDFKLSEEQLMLRAMARDFAQNEVKPVSLELDAKRDPKECIPWDLIKKASKLGLRTLAIPEKFGGGGADYITLAVVLEELGAADQGFATIIRGCYTESPRLLFELNKEQRDEFLPMFLEDDTYLMALARTEPSAGTDAHFLYDAPGASIQTYAEKRGDEYIVNGSKHFISNGGIAKLYFLYARTDKKGPISKSLSLFLLKDDTPGFSIGRFHNKLGRRLLANAELVFEDARIPAKYLVGEEGKAWGTEGEGGTPPPRNPDGSLVPTPPFGLLGAAATLGTIRAAYEETLAYTRDRFQGGKKIIEHQHVALKLAEMKVKVEAVRGLIHRCAWCWDNKYEYDPRAGMLIKGYTDQVAVDVVNDAVSIFGGLATADNDMPVQKYMRDIYTTLHGFATTEVAMLIGAPGLE